MVEPVDVHFLWRPQTRDPSDDMVLEAAINGRADLVITYNVADFVDACRHFDIEVVRPGDLLRRTNRE
jgi:predicted nucleic acid-binding protein